MQSWLIDKEPLSPKCTGSNFWEEILGHLSNIFLGKFGTLISKKLFFQFFVLASIGVSNLSVQHVLTGNREVNDSNEDGRNFFELWLLDEASYELGYECSKITLKTVVFCCLLKSRRVCRWGLSRHHALPRSVFKS